MKIPHDVYGANLVKVGMLSGILRSVAAHHGLTVEELLEKPDL